MTLPPTSERSLPLSSPASYPSLRTAENRGSEMDDTSTDIDTELVDLSQVSLYRLRDLDNSVFANSLRRLFDEIDAATDQTAGFSNSA